MQKIKNASWQVISIAIVGYLTQYLFHMYLANTLSPRDYGDLAVALSLAFFWSFIAECGASKIMSKYIPQYQQSKDMNLMSGLFRSYFYFIIGLGITIALGGTLLATLDVHVLKKVGSSTYHPLVLSLWFLPFIAISKMFSALLKSFRIFIISEIPRNIMLYGLIILMVWLFSSFGLKVTDWLTVSLFGAAYLVVTCTYSVLIHKSLPRFYLKHRPQYELKEWFSMSIPIMFSLIIIVAIKQIDLIMLEVLNKSELGVGYFSAAAQTAQILILIHTSLSVLFAPFLSEALTKGVAETKKMLFDMAKLTSLFCLPLLFILIAAGKIILGWFGAKYIHAYPAMCILAIGIATNAIMGNNITYLQFSGRQVYVLIVQSIALVIDIVLNFILIPSWGITGAGISSTAALVFMTLSITWTTWQRIRRQEKTTKALPELALD